MQFSKIYSDKQLMAQMANIVNDNKVGHAYMLNEESGCGGIAIAIAFAQYILCSNRINDDSCGECPSCKKVQKLIHPDLHFAFPTATPSKSSGDKKFTSKDFLPVWRDLVVNNPYFDEETLYSSLGIDNKVGAIKVDEAKEILEKLSMRAYEGDNKFMIVWLPERMTVEAANKLLKIVEEPYSGTIFLFISQSPERVITTILSRCIRLRVAPLESHQLAEFLTKEKNIPAERAIEWAGVSSGSYGKALTILNESEERADYLRFINEILRGCINRDLSKLFPVYEELSGIGREGQKRFCIYAESFIRKIFLHRNNMAEVASITPIEAEIIEKMSRELSNKFCLKAFKTLDNSLNMIESNVNAKIIFCDMGNSFFISL